MSATTTSSTIDTHALNAKSYDAIASSYVSFTTANQRSWVKSVLRSESGCFSGSTPSTDASVDTGSTTNATTTSGTAPSSTKQTLKPGNPLPSNPRTYFLHTHLLPSLPANGTGSVLDLGCGAGTFSLVPLATACVNGSVLGVDGSQGMVKLAEEMVREKGLNGRVGDGGDGAEVGGKGEGKNGDKVKERVKERVKVAVADMTRLTFPSATFDAVVSFYAFIHLPRDEQVVMLERVYSWLKPGGVLLLNLTARDMPDAHETNWLGSEEGKMYWSGFDAEKGVGLVESAGFEVVEAVVVDDQEDTKIVPFLWVVGRRPGKA
jgi:SAM-dependent methyltransferase